MLRRTALATSMLLIGALLLTSCTGSNTTPNPTGEADPNATLTVRLSLEPSNLDIRRTSGASLEQALIDNVYQGLVTRNGDDSNAIARHSPRRGRCLPTDSPTPSPSARA